MLLRDANMHPPLPLLTYFQQQDGNLLPSSSSFQCRMRLRHNHRACQRQTRLNLPCRRHGRCSSLPPARIHIHLGGTTPVAATSTAGYSVCTGQTIVGGAVCDLCVQIYFSRLVSNLCPFAWEHRHEAVVAILPELIKIFRWRTDKY